MEWRIHIVRVRFCECVRIEFLQPTGGRESHRQDYLFLQNKALSTPFSRRSGISLVCQTELRDAHE